MSDDEKSNATAAPVQRSDSVLSVEERNPIKYYQELGLGRGVDITKQTPWLEKSSFQVRYFEMDDLMETREGGSLQHYETQITSNQQQRSEIHAAVQPYMKAPVTIGVDAENSRSYSYNRHAVGTKIINRTISFKVGFSDAPGRRRKSNAKLTPPSGEQVQANNQSDVVSFEEEFCSWLYDMLDYMGLPVGDLEANEDIDKYIRAIAELLKSKRGDVGLKDQLGKLCLQFISHFGITHYVNAIELGAAKYRVMVETEFNAKVAVGGSFGVEALAQKAVKVQSKNVFSWGKKERKSELKRIGRIVEDGTDGSDGIPKSEVETANVPKTEEYEAVVGIQIRPIHTLVRISALQDAFQYALDEYTKEESRLAGPFHIVCDSRGGRYYLTTEKFFLRATKKREEAIPFTIIPLEGKKPHEFMIMTQLEDMVSVDERRERKPGDESAATPKADENDGSFPYYLEASCDFIGRNWNALRMVPSVMISNASMSLTKRIVDDQSKLPVDISPWLRGKESYFIRCTRQSIKDGYLCIQPAKKKSKRSAGKKEPEGLEEHTEDKDDNNSPEFNLTIVPSVKYHRDMQHHKKKKTVESQSQSTLNGMNLMLFRLQPIGRNLQQAEQRREILNGATNDDRE